MFSIALTNRRPVGVVTGVSVLAVALGCLLLNQPARAAVLPDERADLLYHLYEGGGVTIDGPSVLLRKNVGDSVSVSFNHYVDTVVSASIDVEVSASKYTEQRTEQSLGLDYLRDKTTMSVGLTTSDENDYDAQAVSLNVSQDMFGDLTTLALGFSLGDNTVGQSTDEDFAEPMDSRSYRLSLTQVLTKSLIGSFSFESISDEGYLNNPYRSVRYVDPSSPLGYSFQQEVYPNTRTSSAFAMRFRYFLPQRAALSAGYRIFSDSWGIEADSIELGYTMPYDSVWIFDGSLRFYQQTEADFYSDLFPFQNAQNFLARDKEMSPFDSITVGAGASRDFSAGSWGFIKRASLNFNLDYVLYDYKNFRDLTASGSVGSEPLYDFDAIVLRAFASVWF